jgi:hypothetical protein
MTSEDPVRVAEDYFGIRLKVVTNDRTEFRSLNGCPKCGDGGKGTGSDRFRVFTDGSPRFWCRRCGFTGFLDALEGHPWTGLSREDRRRRLLLAELQQEEAERRQAEIRRAALAELRASNDAATYHAALPWNPTALNYWYAEGFTAATISRFQLGYCAATPIDHPRHRPSVTIPVYWMGQLFDIRHRLLNAAPSDKYRPHLKNLPWVLFNADNLLAPEDYILIVEGEKKSMIATQYGWNSVGIMGQDKFPHDMRDAFRPFAHVYVVLDPDAHATAKEIAKLFGERGSAVALPDKLDDLLNPRKGHQDPARVWAQITGATNAPLGTERTRDTTRASTL